jgi:hypothetical protein
MKKYEIEFEWYATSRGVSGYLVEAENEEEARENYYEGELLFSETIREDVNDVDIMSIVEVTDKEE